MTPESEGTAQARGAADAARAKERGNVQALSEILNMEKESV